MDEREELARMRIEIRLSTMPDGTIPEKFVAKIAEHLREAGYTRDADTTGGDGRQLVSHSQAELAANGAHYLALADAAKKTVVTLRARLTATEAVLAEVREALRPFSDEAKEIAQSIPDETDFAFDFDIGGGQNLGRTDVTVGDFRRARAALARIEEAGRG